MKKNKVLVIICLILMVFALTACGEKSESETNNKVSKIDKYARKINVKMEIENYGTISLELYPNLAPITVNNFVTLVKDGFYDGLTFHRIIDGFMIQGGAANDSSNTTQISNIKGEFTANGVENDLKHERGVISMARADSYDSASTQFFIVQTTYPSLDGLYASFGKVTSGIEIVDEICKKTKVEDDNGTVLPENQPKIKKVCIVD